LLTAEITYWIWTTNNIGWKI